MKIELYIEFENDAIAKKLLEPVKDMFYSLLGYNEFYETLCVSDNTLHACGHAGGQADASVACNICEEILRCDYTVKAEGSLVVKSKDSNEKALFRMANNSYAVVNDCCYTEENEKELSYTVGTEVEFFDDSWAPDDYDDREDFLDDYEFSLKKEKFAESEFDEYLRG